jgi:hypothetical protein
MSQRRGDDVVERYLPVTGIVAVVVFVAAVVFESTGPAPSDSSAQLATKFATDQVGVLIGAYLLLIGTAFLAVFLAVLRGSLRRAEGEPGILSTLTLGAGLAGLALSTSYVAIYGSLAHGVATGGGPQLLYALFAVSNSLDSASGIFISLAVLAAAVVILRTAAFPRWLGWLGLVSGSLGALGAFALDRPDAPIGFAGFIGTVLFLAWTIGVSVVLLRRSMSLRRVLTIE